MILKVVVPGLQFRLLQRESSFWFSRQGEVHYIGGTDVLPPPLSQEEENERISQLATDMEKDAKQVLIEHNLRLVVYIAKKFDNTGIGVEDLISIGTIGLIKAINTYNPEKNIKLATYASRCIENEILMYLRSVKKTARDVYLFDTIGSDKEGNEINLLDVIEQEQTDVTDQMELCENTGRLRILLSTVLNEREREIIYLRYGLLNGEEVTQREIGEMLHISRSYVSRIEKRALLKLREGFEHGYD
mgnify:CR=1 FL=1